MVELGEDEMRNLGKVWASIFVSLSYCFIVGKITTKGVTRLLLILPVISLFLALPLNLTSIHFCGLTAFFIAWLANFKLLLFAFGKPPLCSNSSIIISFPRFVSVACLPIKIQQDPSPKNLSNYQNTENPDEKSQNNSYPPHQNSQKSPNKQHFDQKPQNKPCPSPQKPEDITITMSPWNYIIKGALLALILKIYDYSHHMPKNIIWLIYFIHIYFALEMILACVAIAVKLSLGLELEPQFNEPLLSTSLQDFWGKRWNLMVTSILRPTVYLPTRDLFTRVLGGRQLATLMAVISTFVVSAIMHELIFYYLGRVAPTFEVTWFFLLHGLSLCLEIAAKKSFNGKRRVPRWVSGLATVSFVVATGFWLFLPPLLRCGLVTRGLQDYAAVGTFVRSVMTPG